jgi:hypothetical protein
MSSRISDERSISGINAAAITDTTATDVIAAQGANKAVYVTDITVTNDHATVGTRVDILDGATVKWSVYANAKSSVPVPLQTPLKGTANTAWKAKPATTGSSIFCSLSGYRADSV